MSGGIEITGLRQTIKNLEQAGISVLDLKKAMGRVGDIVARRGTSLAPHRTGKLAASIRPSKSKNQARVSVGRSSLPYAPVIHWGWKAHNIAANPFLSRALDQTAPQVRGAVENEIHTITEKANR